MKSMAVWIGFGSRRTRTFHGEMGAWRQDKPVSLGDAAREEGVPGIEAIFIAVERGAQNLRETGIGCRMEASVVPC